MKIPIYDEIHLSHPPIDEVICQIKFPGLLRIKNEEPYQLQELIRDRYPLVFSKKEIAEEDDISSQSQVGFEYRFFNSDKNNSFTLASDFIALSIKKYDSWKQLLENISFCLRSANTVYKLPFATRIGLRFINFINPEKVEKKGFSDILPMINKNLVSEFNFSQLPSPTTSIHRLVYSENDDSIVFQYGKVLIGSPGFEVFVLDIDAFQEAKINLDAIEQYYEKFHSWIYGLFRWSLQEEYLTLYK